MKQKLLSLLFLLMGGVQGVCAQEAYAVLSEENTKLTFYYDNQKESRGGLSVGPFEKSSQVSWRDAKKSIQTVTFDASFANCTSITSTASWFNGLKSLVKIDGIENLKTDNVTDMSGMFAACYSLKELDLSHFNTSNVTNMSCMFCEIKGSESLTTLDLSNFDTSKVTDMSEMFVESRSLASINISSFNTSNVENMNSMFAECEALTILNLSNFNTANVTDMEDMFRGCTNLTSIDLSTFNTANVTKMAQMFYGCSKLSTIYADEKKWSTNKIEPSTGGYFMFLYCPQLVGGNGTVYDIYHVDVDYARIDMPGQPGYLTAKTSSGIQTIVQDKVVDGNAPIYNLSGKRLTSPQKGINIIGGKKVILK